MYLEVPECRKCCCIPLRHGIIIFAYINLILSVLILLLEAVISHGDLFIGHTMTLYKGVEMYTQMWLALVLYVTEIVFNIVLIIGAHKKSTKLLQVYYYYSMTMALATFLCFLVLRYNTIDWIDQLIEAACATCGLGIQVYLLLLIRSELCKLRKNSGHRFINHISEVLVEAPLTEGRNPF